MAHAPMAITYFGSAIWSYNLFKTGAILFTIVPAMMITSAWRGEALATSKPNREKSYFAAATDIISMPQQLVAKVNGQRELERAQLMMSSNLLRHNSSTGRFVYLARKFFFFCVCFYIHFKAPFLCAYKNPVNNIKKKIIISIKANHPVCLATTAHG